MNGQESANQRGSIREPEARDYPQDWRRITLRCFLFSAICLTLSLALPRAVDAQSPGDAMWSLEDPQPSDPWADPDWAKSIQTALQRANATLKPVLAVVDDALPARAHDLFTRAPLASILKRFVMIKADRREIERSLPFSDAIETARYIVLDPSGRILVRLEASQEENDPDFNLVQDLNDVWTDYVDRTVDQLTRGLKGRHKLTRESALRDAAVFLDAAPEAKRLRTSVSRLLKRIKRDFDRRAAWNVLAAADTAAALSFIAPELSARSPGRRSDALDVFLRTTPRATYATTLAKRASREKNEDCLHRLVGILERYAPAVPVACAALGRLTRHSLPSVRALASLAAVTKAPYPKISSRLLARAKKEAHETVRIASILAIAKIGEKKALSTLEKARRREKRDTAVRDALDLAITALHGTSAKSELDDAISTLRQSIDRSSSDGRDSAPRNDRRYSGRDR